MPNSTSRSVQTPFSPKRTRGGPYQRDPVHTMITASRAEAIDYEETARVATEAFGSSKVVFYPDQIQWSYERCFSHGATVVTLRDGNRKIGHVAMVRQKVTMYGALETAAQLVDLFILEEFRSTDSLRQIYGEVERQCIAQQIRFAFGMPNAIALPVNAHFFGLQPFLWLPIRAGVAVPFRSPALIFSDLFGRMEKEEATALFAQYQTSREQNGLQWDEETLYQRLCGPRDSYGVHATQGLLLISSTRATHGVRYTLLCGFFVRQGAHVELGELDILVRAACHLWEQPIFIYAGINSALPVSPGFLLPKWLRPSPMLLQLRDFHSDRPAPSFDRYELIDFDFA